MSTKLFHSIYSYASKSGCDRPRKNLLEEIKNKIRKIDIFPAIYINIKVVTTTNSKIGLQRSLQILMLDFSKQKNLKSVNNSAQKMILNLVFLFHSTVMCRVRWMYVLSTDTPTSVRAQPERRALAVARINRLSWRNR